MLSLMFCPWISIGNFWRLMLFFVLTSFPPLLYGPCWLLRIWPVPLGNLPFWFTPDCLMPVSWILIFWNSNSRVPLPGLFLLFVPVYLLKLVKASPFPSELWSFALEHAQLYAPSVPIYTDVSKSSEGVGCAAVFPDFNIFISLPVVALVFPRQW